MHSQFLEVSQAISALSAAVQDLSLASEVLGLPQLASHRWFGILEQKLKPQLGDSAFLVVAVVGGTNIGKSSVFNHLAGFVASPSTPFASGTKHPTCILPDGFRDHHAVEEVFPKFAVRFDAARETAFELTDQHLLVAREASDCPENLVLLDTPDIDSTMEVNWERAEAVRQSADVLVAVITQQKYNDAAVKQFFRRAASDRQIVYIVVNQVYWPDDRPFVAKWVKTFCDETGCEPAAVFAAPHDRKAAESLTLPFYEELWPPLTETVAVAASMPQPINLMATLSRLQFGPIKLQTLRGALEHVLDDSAGIPSYTREVRDRSHQYDEAYRELTATNLVEADHWPAPPSGPMVDLLRERWHELRTGPTRWVNDAYRQVGAWVKQPMGVAWTWLGGPPAIDPWEAYRETERTATIRLVSSLYKRLQQLERLGNPVLRQQLTVVLQGASQASLLARLEQEINQADNSQLLASIVGRAVTRTQGEFPGIHRVLTILDSVAAAARPAVTIALGFVGGTLVPVDHLATEVVATAVGAAGGEVLAGSASTWFRWLQTLFQGIRQEFVASRSGWLTDTLGEALLLPLTNQLQTAAQVGDSTQLHEVERLVMFARRAMAKPFSEVAIGQVGKTMTGECS
jgi:50S ribosome-binding GTPase